MRPIDADALIEKCGGWYVDEGTESGFIGRLENLLATEPTIQPVATDTNVGDTISRQAAIDIVSRYNKSHMILKGKPMLGAASIVIELEELPPAQPEPSIPLSWVEKYIEWLKSFDNEFANLEAAHISVMVKKWRREQHETD